MPAGLCFRIAGVAQLVEHLICNQRVRGSNPFASSRKTVFRKQTEGLRGCTREWRKGFNALHQGIFRRVAGIEQVRIEREFLHFVSLTSGAVTKVCLFWMPADFQFSHRWVSG